MAVWALVLGLLFGRAEAAGLCVCPETLGLRLESIDYEYTGTLAVNTPTLAAAFLPHHTVRLVQTWHISTDVTGTLSYAWTSPSGNVTVVPNPNPVELTPGLERFGIYEATGGVSPLLDETGRWSVATTFAGVVIDQRAFDVAAARASIRLPVVKGSTAPTR